MSVMTLDAPTYRLLLADACDRYIKAGMTPAAAAQRAQEVMDSCARCEEDVQDEEFWKDADENGIYA